MKASLRATTESVLASKMKVCFHFPMTKTQAIEIFGSVRALADALGIQPQAIYQWPDDLDQKRVDWVKGAALRLRKPDVSPPLAEARP